MFSSRKFVQYVHNDGCGCHKVPRLPLNTVNVSCMQTEGVELCTKLGAFTVVWQSCLLPASSEVQSVSYRIYILKNRVCKTALLRFSLFRYSCAVQQWLCV